MDFFLTTDWLSREGPYNFKLDHLLFIFIGLGLGFLLAFLLRKRSKKYKLYTIIKIIDISAVSKRHKLQVKYEKEQKKNC